jgi:hypothetical protein
MVGEIQYKEIFDTPGDSVGLAVSVPRRTPILADEMIGILFTQCMVDSPEPPKVFTDFWTLACEAME